MTKSDRLMEMLDVIRTGFEAIILDPQTREAGLWQGDMIPRMIRNVDKVAILAEDAIAEEREACAKIVEDCAQTATGLGNHALMAAWIRARSTPAPASPPAGSDPASGQ